jgi:hypothetical protein
MIFEVLDLAAIHYSNSVSDKTRNYVKANISSRTVGTKDVPIGLDENV